METRGQFCRECLCLRGWWKLLRVYLSWLRQHKDRRVLLWGRLLLELRSEGLLLRLSAVRLLLELRLERWLLEMGLERCLLELVLEGLLLQLEGLELRGPLLMCVRCLEPWVLRLTVL